MAELKFIDGLLAKEPHPKAPDYVKCKISIQRAKLIAWLQAESDEWINANVQVSRGGKWYVAVDDWKPSQERAPSAPSAPHARTPAPAAEGFLDEEIPF